MDIHDTKRVHLCGAPSIQSNVPAIYPIPLPPNITPSHNPGTLRTNDTTKRNCRQTRKLSCIVRGNPCTARYFWTMFFFLFRLNKFKECNVSSQATAWFKK